MFDDNDEMIEREDDEDETEGENNTNTPNQDTDDLKKEKKQQYDKFNSKITVNLGSEEYDKGKEKITQDIFEGKDKTQNAELFIENL